MMIESIFTATQSNLVVATLIAIVALLHGRFGRNPRLTMLFWSCVLLKLIIPPYRNVNIAGFFESRLDSAAESNGLTTLVLESRGIEMAETIHRSLSLQESLFIAWIFGTLVVMAYSLPKILRFNRLLRDSSHPAGPRITEITAELSGKFNLKRTVSIHQSNSLVSPLLWCIFWKPKIYLPSILVEQLTEEDLRSVLAHELAHLKIRSDYGRWLDWFVGIIQWWNPIAWFSKIKLREFEEYACDQVVLSHQEISPVSYGQAILRTVELITDSCKPLPKLASGINGSGSLSKRIEMIVSGQQHNSSERKLTAIALLCGLFILPMSFSCNDQFVDANLVNEELSTAPGTDVLYADGDNIFLQIGDSRELLNKPAIVRESISESASGTRNGEGDKVWVQFEVTPSGQTGKAKIIKGLTGEQNAKTLEIINGLTFDPILVGDRALGFRYSVSASRLMQYDLPERISSMIIAAMTSAKLNREVSGRIKTQGWVHSYEEKWLEEDIKVVHKSVGPIRTKVDTEPELIGGFAVIENAIRYPNIAKKAGVEGKVYVQFVIDPQGQPQYIKVVRGLGAGCDEEAVRVVETLRFIPGMIAGKPVTTRFSLPITFNLGEI